MGFVQVSAGTIVLVTAGQSHKQHTQLSTLMREAGADGDANADLQATSPLALYVSAC